MKISNLQSYAYLSSNKLNRIALLIDRSTNTIDLNAVLTNCQMSKSILFHATTVKNLITLLSRRLHWISSGTEQQKKIE